MRHPSDEELDSEEWERIEKLSMEEVSQELIARGYTETDFEAMEMRVNRALEQIHIESILSQFKLDFSLIDPKSNTKLPVKEDTPPKIPNRF